MSSPTESVRIEALDDAAYLAFADTAAHAIAIEQTPPWDAYDAVVDGRMPWRRVGAFAGDATEPFALIALTEYAGRGFDYLWAKHGPTWIGEQTESSERALRDALTTYVKAEAPHIVFLRMHARHSAPDLHELLQTITYDRTVVIDLTLDDDAYLASLSKKSRARMRRALRIEGTTASWEKDLTREAFDELYAIYEETAGRDEFAIYPPEVYWGMLEALGENARMYVARRTDVGPNGEPAGRAVAWVLSTVYGTGAVYYYAAGNAEARDIDAAAVLVWTMRASLQEAGATALDLMGVESERAPSLASVGDFKRKWGPESAIDGAWDVLVKPTKYRLLKAALKAKRTIRG
ncbi:lipid II:glycine glycyltransferase FemX [Demequina aurantiaca]|uniref:lipid II:glycine glycyltransferase FemX n=1 Tax=Demequina aurantiaca TaxID=676200 RepID=UPI000782C303|nr:GNAT family N-acetyltransferase [Demequina aurantiaca]